MSARLTPQDHIDRAISEEAFQAQLETLLRLYEFDWIYHTHDSQRSERGMPDLLVVRVRDQRTVYIECKRVGERPDADQVRVMSLLHEAGAEVYLLDIRDWDFCKAVFRPPWRRE